MLAWLGKGLLLRLGAYALFVWGFWLLFQAFERSNIAFGVGGSVAVLVAMWAMVGFRRTPGLKPKSSEDDGESESEDNSTP